MSAVVGARGCHGRGSAFDVKLKYVDSGEGFGLPTWASAPEPTGQFSSGIGKYFSNSIREDGFLAIASWCFEFAASAGQEPSRTPHTTTIGPFTLAPPCFLDKSLCLKEPRILELLQWRVSQERCGEMVAVCAAAGSPILAEQGGIFVFVLPSIERPYFANFAHNEKRPGVWTRPSISRIGCGGWI
jgi:hypothetical protein